MASIHKQPNGRWKVRYRTPDGKDRAKRFALKVDAQRFANGIETDKARGIFVDPRAGRITFAEWHKRWTDSTVDLRASTRARDDSYARNHVLPRFGKRALASIDHLDVVEWIAELSASGKAPATVHKCHQILAKCLRAAVRARLIPFNPCDGVALPRVERQEMRFLDPQQLAGLAETINPRYRAFVLLGGYGGLRLGEMLGLRRERVDLLRRRVDVAEILVEVRGRITYGPPKTSAGRRTVPLPRVVAEALQETLESVEPGGLVFTSPEGKPARASQLRRRVWAPAVRAAGLEPLRIHDLRHSAVAFWIAAGASPKEIALRAGHTSVSVVLDRYGHLLPGSEKRTTDALDIMASDAAQAQASVSPLRP
jgi:integrase